MSARRLRATIASGDPLDVRHFHVSAGPSAPFEATVTCVSENHDIDLEAVVGQAGSFSIQWDGGEPRTFSGVVRSFEQTAAEDRGLSTYRMTLVPKIWLLSQRRNHRMFQRRSDVGIVIALLGEWGISPRLALSGSYKKRKYRVQYGETDLDFMSRLLEDAGVTWFSDPASSDVVLSDAPQAGPARAPLPFREHPTTADREHATAIRVGRQVRPGKVAIRDHDYRRPPAFRLLAAAGAGGGVEAQLESFSYEPGAFLVESDKGESTPFADDKGKFRADEGEGAALAERRLSAARAGARTVSFDTNVLDVGPGSVVSFLDHPRTDLGPGKCFLVTASEMRGDVNGEWSHTCQAVSADSPYCPPRVTPRPTARGVESATVVGPPGEEIHTDEHGRVRVHFHWDRESRMDDSSSCWIHVSQPWSGTGYGGTNLPRVGQEVIVDFLGGDPDRPVIVGRVYTSLQKPPYKLPENRTQSGWKSSSTGGEGGYNEVMFEDAAGRELFRMQAERDLDKLVKRDESARIGNDHTEQVGRDESLTVGRDRARRVGHDEALQIGNDQTAEVGNDQTVTVARDQTVTVGDDQSVIVQHDGARLVGNDETITVGNNRSQSVGANESLVVGLNLSENVGGDRSVKIGKDLREKIGDDRKVEVGGDLSEKIARSKTETVGRLSNEAVALSKSVSVGMAYDLTVGGDMTARVSGSATEEVSAKKTVTVGEKITITCEKSVVTIDKEGQITITGNDVTVDGSGKIHVRARGDVFIQSDAKVNVKSGQVNMN